MLHKKRRKKNVKKKKEKKEYETLGMCGMKKCIFIQKEKIEVNH